MNNTSPISHEDFAVLMEDLGLSSRSGTIAVAVSGGADSMALMCLAHHWGEAVALTVDHGLRPSSASEAIRVKHWLTSRGMRHETLVWTSPKPEANIQNAARIARYRLLEDRCRDLGIGALLIAHHQNDQAETLLLRLARGSGLQGLAGMSAITPPLNPCISGVPLRYRPLLNVPKSRLEATCRAFDMEWIEDPSNANPSYARTAARAMLKDPPLQGLSAPRLAKTATRLARTAAALGHYVAALRDEAVRPGGADAVTLALAPFLAAPDDTALRLMAELLRQVGGGHYPPRMEQTETVWKALQDKDFRGLASAGCLIRPHGDSHVLICREPASCAAPTALESGQSIIWDRRFSVFLGPDEKPGTIGALGEDGWRWLLANWPDARARDLPHLVRLGLPTFRRGTEILAVPHLGYDPKTCALSVRSCHDVTEAFRAGLRVDKRIV